MDKEFIITTFKGVAKDRPLLLLVIGQVIVAMAYLLIVGLSIHASDVTVYTRYTAFGEAHFYKSYWQYLLLFLVFGVVVATGHIGILAKLHQMGRRQSAIFVGWMGLAITIIACIYTLAVISLGHAA